MVNGSMMQHGLDFDWRSVGGWIASEKLDGCRCFWDGKQLWTRGGFRVHAPPRFMARLPRGVRLDGELYAGRGGFQRARVATQYARWRDEIRYVAFDAPEHGGNYAERMAFARTIYADCVETFVVRSASHAWFEACRIVNEGGEGLVLREPRERGYCPGRSHSILKLKPAR